MRNRIIYILVFMVVFVLQGKAQCCGTQQLMIQQITASPCKIYYSKYENNPFLYTDWKNASITLLSGETYDSLKIKFDLYKKVFVYYNPTLMHMLTIDNNIIEKVKIFNNQGEVLVNVLNYHEQENKEGEFYFVYYTDSISFWSKCIKKIESYNDYSRASSYLGAFYEVRKEYMVIDGNFITIPKNKRALAKLFPGNKHDILFYANANKLKMDNAKHLALLIEQINELEKANPSVYVTTPIWQFWK